MGAAHCSVPVKRAVCWHSAGTAWLLLGHSAPAAEGADDEPAILAPWVLFLLFTAAC